MKDSSHDFSQLSPVKQQLLQKLLQKKQAGRSAPSSQMIQHYPGQEEAPLSFAQQRLWFLEQLDTNSSPYYVPFAGQLKGPLHLEILEKSIQGIVSRHAALRTVFVNQNDHPVQVVRPTLDLMVPMIDLRWLSAPEQESQIHRLTREEIQQPFDLAQGPLLRVTLLRLKNDEHFLLVTFHHIVTDGWSIGLFIEELNKFYTAACTHRAGPNGRTGASGRGQATAPTSSYGQSPHEQELAPPLPGLPIQYTDFARWQREWLQGEVLQKQLDYWRHQLAGAPPLLELPTDRPRPTIQTFAGATQTRLFSPDLLQQLKSLSQQENVTLFMTLLAAFQVLLMRYSGLQDIVVSTPIANRSRGELENLIGLFFNTLVLRTDLAGNPTFRQLLKRVQKVAVEAYAQQDTPFEKLVEELQPERNLSYQPLSQVVFILQNFPMPKLELPDVSWQRIEVEQTTSQHDLSLFLNENGSELAPDCLQTILEYNTDLFDTATIERLLGHWQTLLEAIVRDPEQPIETLPLLTEAEREQLLVQWNDTAKNYPQNIYVHQYIEAQVEQHPDALAIGCDDEALTYAQLNRDANKIAHLLVQHGVGPEVAVALLTERNMLFVTAMLSIFKTNGVYLPLDPLYPTARLAHMLSQSRCAFVLVSKPLLPTLTQALMTLPEEKRPAVLQLEDLQIQEGRRENLPTRLHPANLAYIIYTSGSTGTPKGVMVEHRGMLNHIYAKMADVQLTGADTLAQNGPQCFDISVWQSLAALMIGGRVQVFKDEVALSAAALLQQIEEKNVSVLQLVPSMLRGLVQEVVTNEGRRPALPNLRWIVPTGDALPKELCHYWLNLYPAIPLLNTYGSTECSDDQCHYPITNLAGADTWTQIMTIGSPIPNMRAYVLDRALSPVPINIIGELYIGGIGVGRGYGDDPVRTAMTFLPDPFSPIAGQRLYKTGDMARYLSNGTIEFLGRVDHLVKVRGYRIEPGEIEAALAQSPLVHESVVLGIGDAGDANGKRLVAYVVPTSKPAPAISTLRSYLQEKLPGYMIPSHFILLDALPLTSNGKIDRRSLPPPSSVEDEENRNGVAPRSTLEELLTEIWAEVLGREEIGIYDNFFERGGHSLLATQVIARLQRVFRIELPVRSIFETPTIAEFSRRVDTALRSGQTSNTIPLVPVSRKQDLPLSFAQQRMWFLDQLAAGSVAYNTPNAVRIRGQLNFFAVERAFSEIVQRHESLRTIFGTRGSQPVQIIKEASTFRLPFCDLSQLEPAMREIVLKTLIRQEIVQPFDLTVGPLLRIMLLRLSEQEHALLLTTHHIISDAWSMSIFTRELNTLYNAFVQNYPSPLAQPPIQYADFAVWQRQWLQDKVLEVQMQYWTNQLRGAPTLILPTDRPPLEVPDYRGATYSFTLPHQLLKDLAKLSRQEGVTPFMTLLATFLTLLYLSTGQQDLVVGTDIANRTQAETEELIGFFVNLLVLRTNLAGQPSFRELLQRVRRMLLDAYVHQDLPFEKIIEALQLEREVHQVPLVRALFVSQNVPPPSLSLNGLETNLIDIEGQTTKFDIAVFIIETAQGLVGTVNYRTDLFEQDTISKLCKHFEVLLQEVVTQPDALLDTLDMRTDTEKSQLLQEETKLHEKTRRKLISARRHVVEVEDNHTTN